MKELDSHQKQKILKFTVTCNLKLTLGVILGSNKLDGPIKGLLSPNLNIPERQAKSSAFSCLIQKKAGVSPMNRVSSSVATSSTL